MLLQTRDGIRCDICGLLFRKQFTYYSMDYSIINIIISPHTVQIVATGSNDICEKCFNLLMEKCKNNIRPVKKNTIKCDICPVYSSGNANIVKTIFAKVVVDSSAKAEGPSEIQHRYMNFDICGKCWKSITDSITKVSESVKQKGEWS